MQWPTGFAGTLADDAVFGAAFVPLVARADGLLRALYPDDEVAAVFHFERAARAWGEKPPVAAAVSLGLVLELRLPAADLTRYLIEAARAEVHAGFYDAAWDHALASILMDGDVPRHLRIAAFEGMVQVAAKTVEHRRGADAAGPTSPEPAEALPLPEVLMALEVYLEAVRQGDVIDAAAYEVVYELGRTLVRERNPGAVDVLQIVAEDVPAGRRALYLLGVHHLVAGDTDRAIELFQRASDLPPSSLLASHGAEAQARDGAVREMAWMASARARYDVEDLAGAEREYRRITQASPHHLTAQYELGWLLMDARKPGAAKEVFTAVLAEPEQTARADEAKLLWGTVLLEDEGYRAAEAHYLDLTKQFTSDLARYDRVVASLGTAVELVDDCSAREAALADPQLSQMLRRPEAQAAGELARLMGDLAAVQIELQDQILAVERLWDGKDENNPFVLLAQDRARVAEVLHDVQVLSLQIQRAEARQGWSASARGPLVAPGHCCSAIREQVKGLRRTVEEMLSDIDATELSLRAEASGMHAELKALKESYARDMPQIAQHVRDAQSEAVQDAITAERTRLRRMLLEGEAGALQAAWRHKDDHREKIRKKEVARKRKLDELWRRYGELLVDD